MKLSKTLGEERVEDLLVEQRDETASLFDESTIEAIQSIRMNRSKSKCALFEQPLERELTAKHMIMINRRRKIWKIEQLGLLFYNFENQ